MRRSAMLAAMAIAVGMGGCSMFETQGPRAVAKLEAGPGQKVWGSVSFVEMGDGVLVRADVRGLRPNGQYGFHVHEKGDCTAADFMSSGGHFNPAGKAHAHFKTPERHAGDMPSLQSDAEGNTNYSFETTLITVRPGPNSVVGKAVVIHANPDDYASQPAGNSGPRIACGLIRAAD